VDSIWLQRHLKSYLLTSSGQHCKQLRGKQSNNCFYRWPIVYSEVNMDKGSIRSVSVDDGKPKTFPQVRTFLTHAPMVSIWKLISHVCFCQNIHQELLATVSIVQMYYTIFQSLTFTILEVLNVLELVVKKEFMPTFVERALLSWIITWDLIIKE